MTERLTTLQQVKDYLGITTDGSDAFLTRLIDAASQFTLNWLNRDSFQVRTYTQNFRGNGKQSAIMLNWPILSATSVGIGGSFVPASVIGQAGMPGSGYVVSDYRFGPQSIDLYGHSFWQGAPSQVIYRAGFRTEQTEVIPATPHQITPTNGGQWTLDVSVTIDGVDATEVDENPATGQYAVDDWGTYTFAAADAGKTAVITYDYAPWDVSFAVSELVAEWYKRRDHIGIQSKSLSGGVGETVTFSAKDMGESIKTSLQPYMNVVPM
jgi:hypothetical protein